MLQFSGERAFALESAFVSQFPQRASGHPNSPRAAEWLRAQLIQRGWRCQIDTWEVMNYSKPVTLHNVVATLPGKSSREIVVLAHHDQSPATIEGADNDGSGIGVLLHLSEIFSAGHPLPYTLVFVATDGEEYGMLGARRYIQTHSNTHNLIAGISLDNLGKRFYSGIDIEAIGQFQGVGSLWLQRLAEKAAQSAGNLWVPHVRPPLDQLLGQAIPISFMDEGPLIAAGVPALGFSGLVPPTAREQHWRTYHSPDDVLALQSPAVLEQSGRVCEVLLRQLLERKSFPEESGPYLYFESHEQVLRGPPLWALFIGLVALFFLGSGLFSLPRVKLLSQCNLGALIPFVGIWLPLVGGLCALYGLVGVGLLDTYAVYPATTKDPALLQPRWLAIALFLLGLGLSRWLMLCLLRRYTAQLHTIDFLVVKRCAFFVVGLAGLYLLVRNPFSLLFFIPLLFRFGITGRRGLGRLLDIALFLLGGTMVFALFYFFGFVIQRINLAILWYVLMMFAIQEIPPQTALVILAVLAAGLSLVTTTPHKARQETE